MAPEVLTADGAAARGITLPTDSTVADEVMEETEAWLRQRIGPLIDERTERFYVGLQSIFAPNGHLGLRRFVDPDGYDITDGLTGATGQLGQAVAADTVRLIESRATLVRTYVAPQFWWIGPYVDVTYTPNDLAQVRSALYELLALNGGGAGSTSWTTGGLESERIGEYQYKNALASSSASGVPGTSIDSRRAIIVSGLLPVRDELVTLYAKRNLFPIDPVINRAELPT